MDTLKLWNIWNYTLGMFPFVLAKNGKFLSVKTSWAAFSAILAVRSVMIYVLLNYVCGFYDNMRGSEPQQFSCYLIFYSNGFVTLRRVWAAGRTARFLVDATGRLERSNRFFAAAVRMALANVALLTFKVLCNSQSGHFSYSVMGVIIGGSLLSWGPELVQSQFSMVCYFLADEFREVGRRVAAATTVEELKDAKRRVVAGAGWFERGLDCFKLDLFIATQLGLLFFYVTLNDVILLVFLYVARFPLAPIEIWQFAVRLGYLFGGLAENMMYTVWLTSASTSVGSQVKSIARTLYKKDVTRMEKGMKEEIFLLVELLNNSNLKVDGYGFTTLNSRLLFKSFTTAMTFIILFIQLFQLRSK